MRVEYTQRIAGRDEAIDALEALAYRDACQMRRTRVPPLYESRVRYRTSPELRRHWQTCREMLACGHGDCADLSAWRVAELRAKGVPARFKVKRTSRTGLYHVLLSVDGVEEDPSAALGMRGDG